MKVIQSYSSPECNTYDVIINDVVVAYYYDHFVNPVTNEKLSTSVFEIYYDYNEGDYEGSLLTENYKDIEYILENL